MGRPLRKILYVEDEPDIQLVAQVALEQAGGLTVQMCDDGRQALAAAASFQPDLILLDVMLPGMDGPATLRALRGQPETAAIPAVYLSARAGPRDAEALLRTGAIGVIAKPFDPMALAGQVRKIWEDHVGP